jgi:hypothetical protein
MQLGGDGFGLGSSGSGSGLDAAIERGLRSRDLTGTRAGIRGAGNPCKQRRGKKEGSE